MPFWNSPRSLFSRGAQAVTGFWRASAERRDKGNARNDSQPWALVAAKLMLSPTKGNRRTILQKEFVSTGMQTQSLARLTVIMFSLHVAEFRYRRHRPKR
jgi:hypothetical protein